MFKADFKHFGFTASPVIEGNIFLLNACTNGIALNEDTGEKIWVSKPGECSYSTPVVYGRSHLS